MKSEMVSQLKELIRNEATKQLAENYNNFLPYVVKIDIDNISDDASRAIGAIYLIISGRLLFIPVIYRNGAVDSISYIGDVDNDMIYGLTDKMYRRLVNTSESMNFGQVTTKEEQARMVVDKGIIGRLFATPQTFSPKVASDKIDHQDAVIMDLLKLPEFRRGFEKMAADEEMGKVLRESYSDEVFEELKRLNRTELKVEKLAHMTPPPIITKIADIKKLPMSERAVAAREIAQSGLYKVAGEGVEAKKRIVGDIPLFGEVLTTVKGNMEILTEPGIYNAVRRDFRLTPVFIARGVGYDKNTYIFTHGRKEIARYGVSKYDKYGNSDAKSEYIGLPASAIMDDPRAHIVAAYGVEVDPVNAEIAVIINNKNDIYYANINSVTKAGNKLAVEVYSPHIDGMTIMVGEEFGLTMTDNTIYVHPNHVLFLSGPNMRRDDFSAEGRRNSPNPFSVLMKLSDLNSPMVKTASINARYSAGRFFVNGETYTRQELMQKMASEGYEPSDVKEMMKLAEQAPGREVTLQEVSSEIKQVIEELKQQKLALSQLAQIVAQSVGTPVAADAQDETTQQIVALAQQVGADPQAIIAAGQQQGMTNEQILAQLQQEVQQYMQGQADGAAGAAGGNGDNTDSSAGTGGVPNPDAGAVPGDSAGNAPVPATGPDTGGAQEPQVAQGGEPSSQELELQRQGYNTNMSPELLQQLREIADKDVLNASIISYMFDNDGSKEVVLKYLDDIRRGVSGLGHTMLMIDAQRDSFESRVGQKQLSLFMDRGKLLLNRLTDFSIDTALFD